MGGLQIICIFKKKRGIIIVKYKRKTIKTNEMLGDNAILVGDMKDILQQTLDSLDGYDDADKIILDANTYGIGRPYIGLSNGFISLRDIENAIEYADGDGYEAFDAKKTEDYSPETVKIGSQIWSAKNLKIDDGGEGIYRRGDELYYTYDAAVRVAATIPGWHLPTKEEFEKLVGTAGGGELASTKLRTRTGWGSGYGGSDDFGFAARSAGFLGFRSKYSSSYVHFRAGAHFWSSTEESDYTAYYMWQSASYAVECSTTDKLVAMSVRLIKD